MIEIYRIGFNNKNMRTKNVLSKGAKYLSWEDIAYAIRVADFRLLYSMASQYDLTIDTAYEIRAQCQEIVNALDTYINDFLPKKKGRTRKQ